MTESSAGINPTINKMTEVVIAPPKQEQVSPIVDIVANHDKLFYRLGLATKPERVHTTDSDPAAPIQRSLLVRNIRAELLSKLQKIRSSKTETPESRHQKLEAIIHESQDWDRLAKEFNNQGEAQVTFEGLGTQVLRYNMLNPEHPALEKPIAGQPAREKPPIVIIPGISNDLECVALMAMSLAREGRRVITLGYPEGFAGSITPAFVDAVEKNKTDPNHRLSLHTQLFQTAIEELTKDYDAYELWGLSTGGPIAAEMLNNPHIQERVSNAAMIAPAAAVEQSVTSLRLGLLGELPRALSRTRSFMPKFVYTDGRTQNPEDFNKNLRKRVETALTEIDTHQSPYWSTMRVRKGGHIAVVTGGKDEVTKSYKAANLFWTNPQVSHATLPNENHGTAFIDPLARTVAQRILSG